MGLTTVEGVKSTIGAGNLIYEGVDSERWGEVFGTSPEYIYITTFPHFQPDVLNLLFFKKELFLCRQNNEGGDLLRHPHVMLKATRLYVPTDNIKLYRKWCRLSILLNAPISRNTLRLIG